MPCSAAASSALPARSVTTTRWAMSAAAMARVAGVSGSMAVDDTRAVTNPGTDGPRLGLRANAGQFALLVGVNCLVGGMVGQERTVLPLLGRDVFGLDGFAIVLTFLVAFGFSKALSNLAALA